MKSQTTNEIGLIFQNNNFDNITYQIRNHIKLWYNRFDQIDVLGELMLMRPVVCSEQNTKCTLEIIQLYQLHHQFVCTDNHDHGTYMSWDENSECKRPDRHP